MTTQLKELEDDSGANDRCFGEEKYWLHLVKFPFEKWTLVDRIIGSSVLLSGVIYDDRSAAYPDDLLHVLRGMISAKSHPSIMLKGLSLFASTLERSRKYRAALILKQEELHDFSVASLIISSFAELTRPLVENTPESKAFRDRELLLSLYEESWVFALDFIIRCGPHFSNRLKARDWKILDDAVNAMSRRAPLLKKSQILIHCMYSFLDCGPQNELKIALQQMDVEKTCGCALYIALHSPETKLSLMRFIEKLYMCSKLKCSPEHDEPEDWDLFEESSTSPSMLHVVSLEGLEREEEEVPESFFHHAYQLQSPNFFDKRQEMIQEKIDVASLQTKVKEQEEEIKKQREELEKLREEAKIAKEELARSKETIAEMKRSIVKQLTEVQAERVSASVVSFFL